MSNEPHRKTKPLFLVLLMLLAPFASANVTTFANGDESVDVEIRDGNDLQNLVDGAIELPDGETVTGATMKVHTHAVEHGHQSRIDLDTTQRVWNPLYNNQLTEFSDESLFQYEDGTEATPVSLISEGFLTDFEGTNGGFYDSTDPANMPSSGVGLGTRFPLVFRHPSRMFLWPRSAGEPIWPMPTTPTTTPTETPPLLHALRARHDQH